MKLMELYKKSLLNEKMSWDEYRDTQFDEDDHRYLPSDYFTNKYETQTGTKHKFPKLLDTINGFEYREYKYGGVGAFDGEKQIGFADSGAVEVSDEYQRKGIGVELIHLVKKMNPKHRFGSMTPAGWNLMRAYYDKKVK